MSMKDKIQITKQDSPQISSLEFIEAVTESSDIWNLG
jgi:hypothetical protein